MDQSNGVCSRVCCKDRPTDRPTARYLYANLSQVHFSPKGTWMQLTVISKRGCGEFNWTRDESIKNMIHWSYIGTVLSSLSWTRIDLSFTVMIQWILWMACKISSNYTLYIYIENIIITSNDIMIPINMIFGVMRLCKLPVGGLIRDF